MTLPGTIPRQNQHKQTEEDQGLFFPRIDAKCGFRDLGFNMLFSSLAVVVINLSFS